ncbi:MAG TPA: DUF6364 family protein [Rhodothermales bacterium]|nr:DUF6364 family protein [Rhodothermales bacterium]
MDSAEIRIRLPKRDLAFVEAYAKEHRLTVAQVIDRSLKLLQKLDPEAIHPDLRAITGIIPPGVNAEEEYYNHLLRKHQ